MDVFETQRKQQLAELEAQRAANKEILRESEERFRTIFEMAPFGMDIVGPDGRPIQANLALQNMLGYTAGELRSMVYSEYTHPDDVEISQRLVREIAEGQRDYAHLEKRYFSKDGSLVWALVVILAVDGFSSVVDITEVVGLLERVGMPGLGFSMGVAVNLLPALRTSSQNVWRSLRMRGGFRRQWWRGLQYLLVTVVSNALRRAEEISLAAEVRGFSPERSRAPSLKVGAFDRAIFFVALLCWGVIVFA